MAQNKPITNKCSCYRCKSKRFYYDILRLFKVFKKLAYLGWLKTTIAYHKTQALSLVLDLLPQLWIWKTKTISITDKNGVIFTQPIIIRAKNFVIQLAKKFTKKKSSNKYALIATTSFLHVTKNVARFWQEISSEFGEIFGIADVLRIKAKIDTSLQKRKKQFFTFAGRQISTFLKIRKSIKKCVPTYIPYAIASILLATGILSICYGTYIYIFKDLPEAKELVQNEQIVTTRILDRNGNLLFRIYEDENRTLVNLNQIPQHTVQATIAIEDQDFYDHHGFSIKGILRAVIANTQGKPVQGGSTITQQLVKNRLLTSERTLRRKIREVLLAVVVDGTFTKNEILEMYLNQVAYGGATYGIEEAAQTYFGKPAAQLSLAESAMLAGLPAAPSAYNPFGSSPELAYIRQHEVLRRMVIEGFITEEQASQAQQEELAFRSNSIDIKAPHFVMYVRELLAKQYGEDILNQGGLEVRTTLDLKLQEATQEIVTTEVTNLAKLRVSNGAALVTNPTTGEILAMIGSKDYFDFENDGQVNVTIRLRQPGSSIKPLTYAVALEKGKNPQTIIEDTPVVYNIPGSPPYAPKNYDGKYHGRVTLRQALASSYNIPAVKLLAEVGINSVLDKAEAIGISTWGERNRFGLSLTLGGGEVMMTELSELYGTFANDGYTEPLNPILEVTNSKGETLYKNSCALDNKGCVKKRNFDPRVAYQITDILKDNNARTPAFGPQSVLTIPNQEVAVKTGTTNNLRDNWTVGYTSDILVAVWVGNNDNTSMSYVASGITGASPIWNTIIRLTLDDENPHRFSVPDGLVKVEICEQTGTLTCNGCPRTVEATFLAGTEPTTQCNPWQFKPKPSPVPGEQQGQIL